MTAIMIDPTLEKHRRVMISESHGGTGLYMEDWRDTSPAGRRKVISSVEAWLKAERQRGLDRHWAYSLPRHTAVWKAWKIEKTLAGAP